MILSISYILLGFVLLVKGGDMLVDGAVAIARKAKLSSMVIGLTIVGFGTSAPELLVSLQAAMAQSPGIAIGNVVGSNIANIALILGVTSLIHICPASRQTLHIDTPMMILAAILLAAVGLSGTIGRIEGIIGVMMLACFIWWEICHGKTSGDDDAEQQDERPMSLLKALIFVAVSFAALSFGADRLIVGASSIARFLGDKMGMDAADLERIIGLTIVAVGTSLPELFASVMAARKGQTDMAIGNVIGSVTFNILSVIGMSAAICPIENAKEGFELHYLIMVALCLLLWVFLRTKRTLEHWEGAVLTCIYVGYIAYTLMQ